jgi:sulfate transport system ATP-binding protein
MSIVLDDLVKSYGGHGIVDHVSLEVADGELFVLLGPSGSGKSTILRLIAGLAEVEGGRILLHGQDVTDLAPQKRNVGFVFQNYALFRHLTAAENIEFPLRIRKVPKAERLARRDELLALISMAGLGGRYPRQLSGGQQQRVAVARALASNPAVLLLDEPFGALDTKIRGQLRQSLKAVQRKLAVTTILVTHDQEEAFELADRIGVIDRGRLLEVGDPPVLYHRPRHEFVATFLGSANLLAGDLVDDTVRIGALSLPATGLAESAPPGTRQPVAVLFRPEDVLLAADPVDLPGPVLGEGLIEESLFLGPVQRVRVRLQALPGTWPLSVEFGEAGLGLQVALLSAAGDTPPLAVGQRMWVGFRAYHCLPRTVLRLVVAIHDASAAASAVRLGAVLARGTGGPATLLAVADDPTAARALLAASHEAARQSIPGLTVATRAAPAAEAILSTIAAGDFDLVVVGAAEAVPGASLPEPVRRLVLTSPVPVAVAKSDRPAILNVLLCTAGGEPGKLDVAFGGRLARQAGAAVTLLYVDGPGTVEPAADRAPALPTAEPPADEPVHSREWIDRHLRLGAQTLERQGIATSVRVRQGAVVDEILAEAAAGDHDLIVVGGRLHRAAYGQEQRDLALQVVTRADRPVLVVRGSIQ